MKKKGFKKMLALTAAVLAAGSLAACGSAGQTPETTKAESSSESESTDASQEVKKLTVAASPTPHAEILEAAKPFLLERGIELEIVEFTDYVQPNLVLDAGDVDANYFQHKPYLDNFNEEQGTKLGSAGLIHYEPLGIYPGVSNDLSAIKEGAEIAVPNDTTNEARALLLLEINGIIKLKEGAGLAATIKDIEENPYNVKVVELEAAQVSRVIGEVDFAVLNGNYALQAGFNVQTDALAMEEKDSDAASTYANVIAVKEGDENREDIQILVDVLTGEDMNQFMLEKYEGSVVSVK